MVKCTCRIARIAREIATTKCMDPLCSRRNTTFRLTRGKLGGKTIEEWDAMEGEKCRKKVEERAKM